MTTDDTPSADAPFETTLDAMLGGRLRLRQPRRGYRAGLDAALLAAAVSAQPGERVIEAGCGVGAVLHQIAARRTDVELLGLERDAAAAELARENVRLNGLEARIDIRTGDVAAGFRALGVGRFDWAVANPPFFDDPGALRAPLPARRGAWIADDGLVAWLDFLMQAVRDGGHVVVVHRADRLADILAGLGEKCGGFSILSVHPFADQPAKRVLVKARCGGRAPLRLLAPLVLHDRDGAQHRPEVDAILRGEAALDL